MTDGILELAKMVCSLSTEEIKLIWKQDYWVQEVTLVLESILTVLIRTIMEISLDQVLQVSLLDCDWLSKTQYFISGSGGGLNYDAFPVPGSYGGIGGGAIHLVAQTTFQADGEILAAGTTVAGQLNGGAGGSVSLWLCRFCWLCSLYWIDLDWV